MGHFYDKDGNPRYTIKGANGKERDTTLRDAKKYGWNPSVTTVENVVSKPGLVNWQINQVLLAALKYKDVKISESLNETQWKAIVLQEANKIGEETSKRGNEIHTKLEEAILSGSVGESDPDAILINKVLDVLKEKVDLESAHPEHSFASHEGFGGKVDLYGIVDLPWEKSAYLVDFKTKNKDVVDKSCVTIEHGMQLAAYLRGLDIKPAKCYNVYISSKKLNESIDLENMVYIHEWKDGEISKCEEMFLCLLNYWKLLNNVSY